jgi:hypothetical protein
MPQEQVLDTPYYDMWPLAGLMAGVTVDTAVETAEKIAAALLPQEERQELTGLLATLAAMRVSGRVLRDALRSRPMLNDIRRESTVGEIFREDDLRDALRLVLEGRFGALDADLLAADRAGG